MNPVLARAIARRQAKTVAMQALASLPADDRRMVVFDLLADTPVGPPGCIATDADLVATVDELCHQLKPCGTPLGLSFRAVVHAWIAEHGLDGGQHHFAVLPTPRPEGKAEEAP